MESSDLSFLTSQNKGIKELFTPLPNSSSFVDNQKIRRLYLQATAQQWVPPNKLNFDTEINLPDEVKKVWITFHTIFYTLEKMGLNVITYMMPKAVQKLKSDDVNYYLTVQASDESRHVFSAENYLKKLGATPKYDRKMHILGQVASLGFYRVENWLFSTLFSENFASAYLRKCQKANIDPLGQQMCKTLLLDESRHLHFLHIILPDILDRLGFFGRNYVKLSQFFIMKFTQTVSKAFDADAKVVGLNRQELLEEAFENVEKAYEQFGVTKDFLWFPNLKFAN